MRLPRRARSPRTWTQPCWRPRPRPPAWTSGQRTRDLRFVLLRRDPADAAMSISRRTAVPFAAAARILRDSDAVLASQLRRMSSAFVHELRYEAPDAKALAGFLRLNASILAESMRRHFKITKYSRTSPEERAYVRHLWR
mmetsp:Transcript_144921/g.403648  ORF Transcript_144921/g.403648 Transcript_144921/m.403648 type:complete len:140 (-) Transcript_144921:103-522(-)